MGVTHRRGDTSCTPTFFKKSSYILYHIAHPYNNAFYAAQRKEVRDKSLGMPYTYVLLKRINITTIINTIPIKMFKKAYTAITIGTTYICSIWASRMIFSDTFSS